MLEREESPTGPELGPKDGTGLATEAASSPVDDDISGAIAVLSHRCCFLTGIHAVAKQLEGSFQMRLS